MNVITIAAPDPHGPGFIDLDVAYTASPADPSVGWRGGIDIEWIADPETGARVQPGNLGFETDQIVEILRDYGLPGNLL